MSFSINDVYREKFLELDYCSNFKEYMLLRSCREKGFEEIGEGKPKNKKTADDEITRICLSRIKSKIKEYALCNNFNYFFTQTLNSNYNRYDLEEFKKLIQKEFKAYRRKNKNFKYLIIYEKHKDGAYHLHGLVSGLGDDVYKNDNGYLSLKFFENLGFNSLSKVQDNVKVSHYITKYISKEAQKTKSGYTYFHSKDLKKCKKTEVDFNEMKNDLELVYQNEFVKKYKRKEDIKNENV